MAAELYESGISIRALGMGNAYSAVVADKESLFYNPAGLNRISGYYITVIDPYGGADGADVIETVQDLDTSNIATTIEGLSGKQIWLGFGAQAAFAMKNFGVSYFDKGFLSTFVDNPVFPNVNVSYFNDLGYSVGVAFNIMETASFGIATRKIDRTGGSFPVGLDTLGALSGDAISDEFNLSGTGYSLDLGFLLKLPTGNESYLSFVYKNLGNTVFKTTTGTAPEAIEAEMIMGWSMEIDAPGIVIKPSFDYKHMNKSSVQLGKRIHLGVEIEIPVITLRAGLNQGYYTLGAGLQLGVVQLDLATYGVELGEYPGQHEDRRYLLQMTIELGLDFDFSFSDYGSANRRKLKQRR